MAKPKRPLSEPSLCVGRVEFWFDEMIVDYKDAIFALIVKNNELYRINAPGQDYAQNDTIQAAYKKWFEEKEIENLIFNKEIIGMKKTVIVEIELSSEAAKKLEEIAHHRDYTCGQYLAEVVQSKILDMVEHPVEVSFKLKKE